MLIAHSSQCPQCGTQTAHMSAIVHMPEKHRDLPSQLSAILASTDLRGLACAQEGSRR